MTVTQNKAFDKAFNKKAFRSWKLLRDQEDKPLTIDERKELEDFLKEIGALDSASVFKHTIKLVESGIRLV
ncbi:hypothetical protein [Desulfogranum marinum]|uniref:hypothetical protein n=1 Tax=Desulfogranum marinum TaxID=453220 RepID=UPI0029C63184|nr:hypothetical protein [Desulfogranum marinum]